MWFSAVDDSLILVAHREEAEQGQNVPALLGFAAAVEHFTQPDVDFTALEQARLTLGATIIGGEADRLYGLCRCAW